MVYTWYIHGILHVYAVLKDMSGVYLVKTSWVCSVPFFIMIYLCYTMNISIVESIPLQVVVDLRRGQIFEAKGEINFSQV